MEGDLVGKIRIHTLEQNATAFSVQISNHPPPAPPPPLSRSDENRKSASLTAL